jgi:hypothetical protein
MRGHFRWDWKLSARVLGALLAVSPAVSERSRAENVSSPQDRAIAPRILAPARDRNDYYLPASLFDAGAHYKKVLTASFVFELEPCGTLEHGLVYDNTINLCRDRPPPPGILR